MLPVRRLLTAFALLALALAGGSSVAGAQDEQAVAAKPKKPFADMSDAMLRAFSRRDLVAETARAQVGQRYRRGATGTSGAFDCSGLVQYVLSRFGVALPRTAAQQARMGVPVTKDPTALRPGDLLTFGTASRITHVGIYVGEGRYVHAASTRSGVIESEVPRRGTRRGESWWRGVRRLPGLDDESMLPPAGPPTN